MVELSDYIITSIMPLLELPLIQNYFHLDENTLDLKRIISERSNAYRNTVMSRLERHNDELKNFSIVKIFTYGVPILVIIITIVTVVFVVKTNGLRKLISVANLLKITKATPSDQDMDNNPELNQ